MNRKTARENAFILLFEKTIKEDETFEEIFLKATCERALETDEYVKKVFFGNAENERIVDMKIDECLVGWKKERVSYEGLIAVLLVSGVVEGIVNIGGAVIEGREQESQLRRGYHIVSTAIVKYLFFCHVPQSRLRQLHRA